ncbi:hypothetical protein Cfor_07443 [Coptotermes formosanus]|jgi:transposase|uniref:Mos1 transposase HTH domain-containing protein n=1 Tax=Coptotermes formosanus TaxID=36987 RepID=A0A6L2PY62_COPFO|nr:hypothetical protein Cfor_07443 [Coptotermes formosanus]
MKNLSENSAICEIGAVMRFMNAKNRTAAEIYGKCCDIYGPNVMNVGKVRQWVRQYKDSRTNLHDEDRSGRPSVVNAELV